jgi:hypothetical protein
MDYSSLPTFPPPLPSKSPAPPQPRRWRLTPRQGRILIDLAKLAGIMALVLWLRHTADAVQRPPRPNPPPAPPLDFQVVERKYPSVRLFAPDAEVRAALGTPTRYAGWGGEFAAWEARAKHSNRHLGIPSERLWWVWADPADEGRWVAVLIAGDKAYYFAEHGVERTVGRW